MSFSAQYPPVLTEAGDLTSEVLGKYNQEFQYLYTNLLSALFSATTGHAHTGNGSDGAQLGVSSIASDAITTLKILNEAVTAAKLATDAVTADKILADAVTTVKILNGAITTAKFAADAKSPFAGTADKVAHALTINGMAFDGSEVQTFVLLHGQQKFTASSTFTVPAGVSTVYLSGAGGGGAGMGGTSPTVTAGGATSFGSLLTLTGGGAGTLNSGGASGGFGGQAGARVAYDLAETTYYYVGGDTIFGVGGKGLASTPATGYGAGGGGNTGGGGGGQCCIDETITVVAGQSYTVTIGSAGTNNKNSAYNGAAGFLVVKW